jgi:large subunit ribosomal protein L15
MPLFRRVARRGFSNYPFKKVAIAINVERLEERFADGDVVNLESLVEKGLIGKNDRFVKILGTGSLTKKLTVEIRSISASAREKIEKAGGSVVEKREVTQQDETHGE